MSTGQNAHRQKLNTLSLNTNRPSKQNINTKTPFKATKRPKQKRATLPIQSDHFNYKRPRKTDPRTERLRHHWKKENQSFRLWVKVDDPTEVNGFFSRGHVINHRFCFSIVRIIMFSRTRRFSFPYVGCDMVIRFWIIFPQLLMRRVVYLMSRKMWVVFFCVIFRFNYMSFMSFDILSSNYEINFTSVWRMWLNISQKFVF